MKKSLMSGMAAVALCAAFTSCSNHEFFDADRNQAAESVTAAYKQAFISTIGKPAANQDWGFGTTRANTRASINVNGNEEKYEDAPTLGETEENDVVAYVKALTTYPNEAPTGLVNYFVTQVHGGTDTYTDLANNSGILGSSMMNHLMIAMDEGATITNGELSDGWYHINNFNRGNDTDWKGNTLVEDGATLDFAYLGSSDSKYHNRWIAIDGADIDAKYAGYYYVCFDFEATNDNVQTVFEIPSRNGEKATVNGAYTTESAIAEGLVVKVSTGWDAEAGMPIYTEYTVGEDWKVVQYVNGNQVVIGDNDYTDWIVRLVKATPKQQGDADFTIRVIGEDLSASEQGDFDFNDVVFDVALNVDGKTQIKLQAAGGTLPLIIGVENPSNDQDYTANEVHYVFGGYDVTTMINTNAGKYGKSADGVAPAILILDKAYGNAKDIPVYVKKNGAWVEFTAERGEPASKIGVSTDFQWVNEKEYIGGKYPNFIKWVTENTDNVSKWY